MLGSSYINKQRIRYLSFTPLSVLLLFLQENRLFLDQLKAVMHEIIYETASVSFFRGFVSEPPTFQTESQFRYNYLCLL